MQEDDAGREAAVRIFNKYSSNRVQLNRGEFEAALREMGGIYGVRLNISKIMSECEEELDDFLDLNKFYEVLCYVSSHLGEYT